MSTQQLRLIVVAFAPGESEKGARGRRPFPLGAANSSSVNHAGTSLARRELPGLVSSEVWVSAAGRRARAPGSRRRAWAGACLLRSSTRPVLSRLCHQSCCLTFGEKGLVSLTAPPTHTTTPGTPPRIIFKGKKITKHCVNTLAVHLVPRRSLSQRPENALMIERFKG